ncbi:tRNA-splicing endonuclease subunit Sen15 [Schizosaccharomyces japonicus yFS275]|uniref:tRNA-splicing endonuclease subunit Sen15 n=1 Tax=Schizosaccharomyces japonicus (strain yFS275 / FY16936) TaxID=402676 RepID=B6K831_SCHJY|nr:tRNA-splicing endonuclease subunit Sen15 [Schizosaccharomyces japonicus yFS275]EEB09685.1 tRNA-splicing endonuclease subunit Sen15 [Schizosaccharomyces japonicus yFS275]
MATNTSPFQPIEAVKANKHSSFYGLIKAVELDLRLGHQWTELNLHMIDNSKGHARPLFSGIPGTKLLKKRTNLVLPLYLHETVSVEFLASVFDSIKELKINKPIDERGLEKTELYLYLGIMCEDSTIIYYKVTDGLVKPRQNDEE